MVLLLHACSIIDIALLHNDHSEITEQSFEDKFQSVERYC